MKKVTIYEDVHREVKAEAARLGRTFPNVCSELLKLALEQVRTKKVKLRDEDVDATKEEAAR